MDLHIAIKDIVKQKGVEIIKNVQIINYLLDYQAFKEKPATKLILRDVINGGYAEEISSLKSQDSGWTMSFIKLKRDFIDSCGYKEELVDYVFEAIAYGIGMGDASKEPKIEQKIDVQSFFDIAEEPLQEEAANSPVENNQNVNQSDLYSIALTFFNEGKYKQAKSFIDKSISLLAKTDVPYIHLKLRGDINMHLGYYVEAISDYNESYTSYAKKNNIEIAKLKILVETHKIKEFENNLYCYCFCLYSLGKISNEQWNKLVKSEAMFGISDAIVYCINNGINPMDKHIDVFFREIQNLKNGDWVYHDGTFAHELNNGKKVVAKVKLAETTNFEKSQGWTHGYIIPANKNNASDICISGMWSTQHEDLPFPHSHYTNDDLNHWEELQTIESEHYISIDNYDLFPAFKAVHNFPLRIPIKGISPWFLPSIHWFKRFTECTWGKECWTSSQANSSQAVCVSSYRMILANKTQNKFILPVAAF